MEENYDIIAPLSAEGLFRGWEWQKPGTALELSEIATFLRDRVLHPVRHAIEQQTQFSSLMSFDFEDRTKPIQVRWDTQLTPTCSWSSKWGLVCHGMQIIEMVDGNEHPIGMVQLGGTWIDSEEYQHLPAGCFIKEFFRKRERKCYLLLLESYFLTRWSIEQYAMGMDDCIREPEAVWHQVPTQQDWLNVIDVMGTAMLRRTDHGC